MEQNPTDNDINSYWQYPMISLESYILKWNEKSGYSIRIEKDQCHCAIKFKIFNNYRKNHVDNEKKIEDTCIDVFEF